MTNPNDLIRRGDALYALHNDVGLGTANPAYRCINAIPAAPEVLALESILERGKVFDAMVEAAEDAADKGVSFNVVVGRAIRAALAAWDKPEIPAKD